MFLDAGQHGEQVQGGIFLQDINLALNQLAAPSNCMASYLDDS